MLTQEKLKEYLSYNPETGVFVWIKSTRPGWAGKIASHVDVRGYNTAKIEDVRYLCHRLVWLYVYGSFPDGQIDHIDNDKLNNKLSNLRVATHHENQRNKTIHKNNKVGVKGVVLHQCGKYRGCVGYNKVRYDCGLHATIELAQNAVKRKRQELHGEFCNHG